MLELKYWFEDELYEYSVETPELIEALAKEMFKEMQDDARRARRRKEVNITAEQIEEVLSFLHNQCDIDVCEIARSYEAEILDAFKDNAETEWNDVNSVGDPIPRHWRGGRF